MTRDPSDGLPRFVGDLPLRCPQPVPRPEPVLHGGVERDTAFLRRVLDALHDLDIER